MKGENMKRLMITILAVFTLQHVVSQDTIWVKYDNRFKANKAFSIATADSIEFRCKNATVPFPC